MSPYTYEHPRPSVAVDIVVFHPIPDGWQVLLIRRGREPFKGYWALPGGFVELDESLEATARRELQEETGLAVPDLDQIGAYGDPARDPRGRVISIAYLTFLHKKANISVKAADDASQAAWFPVNNLPPLAFDHDQILEDANKALRNRTGLEKLC
jgi:8-oxo-dGTP diphosphatase